MSKFIVASNNHRLFLKKNKGETAATEEGKKETTAATEELLKTDAKEFFAKQQ